jgi:hypothetical protein
MRPAEFGLITSARINNDLDSMRKEEERKRKRGRVEEEDTLTRFRFGNVYVVVGSAALFSAQLLLLKV